MTVFLNIATTAHMTIQQILQQFNLSEKHTAIYLAALRESPASVAELAKAADIKRPTAYVIIDELLEQHILRELPEASQRTFEAIQPKELLEELRRKVYALEKMVPELEQTIGQTHSPHVRVYEGSTAIEQVYTMLKPDAYNNKELLFFGSVSRVHEQFGFELDYFLNFIKHKKVRGREILAQDVASKKLAEVVESANNKQYQVRFLSNELLPLDEAAIIGNRLFLFDLSGTPLAIVIESEAICNTHRALFETAWQQAVPMKEVL